MFFIVERLWLVETIIKSFMNLLSREINHFRVSPVITVSKNKDGTVYMTPLSTILFSLEVHMFTEEQIKFYRNKSIYNRSMALVKALFNDKSDKAHKNYMDHLRHVSNDFKNPRLKSMALMHDVLEDTSVTREDLRNLGYDHDFITVLEILTNTYDSYDEYIDHIVASNNKNALAIKLKDLLHNMDLLRLEKVTEKDLQRTKKYIKAYCKIIEKMKGEENDRY